MARKAAEKKESSKKIPLKASVNKGTGKKNVKKNVAKKGTYNQKDDSKITLKAIKALVSKGKKQGYLTTTKQLDITSKMASKGNIILIISGSLS